MAVSKYLGGGTTCCDENLLKRGKEGFPYSVTRAFLGAVGEKSNYVQMCPENLPTCSYPLDPVTFIVYPNSLGKALDFAPCDAITTQNEHMSLLN